MKPGYFSRKNIVVLTCVSLSSLLYFWLLQKKYICVYLSWNVLLPCALKETTMPCSSPILRDSSSGVTEKLSSASLLYKQELEREREWEEMNVRRRGQTYGWHSKGTVGWMLGGRNRWIKIEIQSRQQEKQEQNINESPRYVPHPNLKCHRRLPKPQL